MIVQKESKYNNVLRLLDPLQDQSKTYKDVIQQYIKGTLDLKLETYLKSINGMNKQKRLIRTHEFKGESKFQRFKCESLFENMYLNESQNHLSSYFKAILNGIQQSPQLVFFVLLTKKLLQSSPHHHCLGLTMVLCLTSFWQRTKVIYENLIANMK